MGVLDQVTQMKSQGMADEEIANSLQQQGINAKDINDAMAQSQIKTAVTDAGEPTEPIPQDFDPMQPPIAGQETYTPQVQEMPEQDYSQQANYPEQDYAQADPYQQQAYSGYDSSGSGTDTMIQVAEQVFQEKVKNLQNQLDVLNEFRTIAQTKVENIDERLKRIETTIDKLQIAILDKVGSYGKGLERTKKELAMVQDTFRKTGVTKTRKAPTKRKKK